VEEKEEERREQRKKSNEAREIERMMSSFIRTLK
jgi:hypothetical protein